VEDKACISRGVTVIALTILCCYFKWLAITGSIFVSCIRKDIVFRIHFLNFLWTIHNLRFQWPVPEPVTLFAPSLSLGKDEAVPQKPCSVILSPIALLILAFTMIPLHGFGCIRSAQLIKQKKRMQISTFS
jgi:hypothetical protein